MDPFNESWPAGKARIPVAAGQGGRGGPPAGAGGTLIVGGLPWASPESALEADRAPLPAPVTVSSADDASAKPFAGRLRGAFARSPAWSLSLSLHVLLLLVLALWVIRRDVAQSRIITVSFGEAGRPAARPAADAVEIARVPEPPSPAPKQPEPTPEPVPLAIRPVEQVHQPTPSPVATAPSNAPSRTAGGSRVPITSQLSGRGESGRTERLRACGGTAGTEDAVARALGWLAKQADRKDGLWSLTGPYADGGSQENRLAATAMALLAFQGAGTTPSSGSHAEVVDRAWKTLLKRQRQDGTFQLGQIPDQHQLYSHAQITIALCEAAGMTGDERFVEPARRALRYCLAAQMPDGGWRYRPPEQDQDNRGDMSVTGWFLMALKTAEMAGLAVPSESYTRLESFLDNVFLSDEKGYGYQINPHQKVVDFRPAITAEGLLCRQYLGWGPSDPRLLAGMKLLLDRSPLDFGHRTKNVYAWYYQTQVFHHAGGEAWETWNTALRERLPAQQLKNGREAGSWERANDQWGHIGGRLYVTCLCTLMLESYYRHLPIFE